MAGIRHHILPRFLLKGFASRVQGEESFTWVYHKGRNPYETNTKNVSVEKFFYGKEGELCADDEITKLEGEYAVLIEELREKDDRYEVSNIRIGAFIAHLLFRTKLLRNFAHNSAEYMLDELAEHFSDFENMKNFILKRPNLIKGSIEEELKKYPISKRQKKMLMHKAQQSILTPIFLKHNETEIKMKIQSLIKYAKNALPKMVKDGHVKALNKKSISGPRVDSYNNLRWFVCKSTQPLILGDTGCLFEINGKKRFRAINDKDEQILNVFLPISSDRILVGVPSSMPQFSFDVINEAIAKCSQEYFVCSASSENFLKLHTLIGKDASILSNNELEQIVDGLIHDMGRGSL